MGDRANILVRCDSEDSGVYLYTHFDRAKLPIVLKWALERHKRWDDPAYLTRIIFDEMTKDDHGKETGYGISTHCCDGEDHVLIVDCNTQTVSYRDLHWSFEDYIAKDRRPW